MRSDRNRLRPDANRVLLACERLEERETPAAGHVARFNADGTLDRTFSGDGKGFTAFVGMGVSATGLAVQADGKIVVVGRGTPTNGSPGRAVLARFNSDGSLDTTFDGDGQAITT